MLPSKDVKWDFITLDRFAGGAKDHCNPKFWYNVYDRICYEQRGCNSVCCLVKLYFICIKIYSCDTVSPARALDFCSVLQGARRLVSNMSVPYNSSEGVRM